MGMRREFLLYTFDGRMDRRDCNVRLLEMHQIATTLNAKVIGQVIEYWGSRTAFKKDIVPRYEKTNFIPTLVVSSKKDLKDKFIANFVRERHIPTIIVNKNLSTEGSLFSKEGWMYDGDVIEQSLNNREMLGNYLTGFEGVDDEQKHLEGINSQRAELADREARRLIGPLKKLMLDNPKASQGELAELLNQEYQYKKWTKDGEEEIPLKQTLISEIISRTEGKDFWKKHCDKNR